MDYLAPTERFLRRTVLLLLLTVALGGAMAVALHLLHSERHWLDLIVPSLLTVVMLGLFVHLLCRPASLLQVIWVGTLCSVVGLAIPAWYYTIVAWREPYGSYGSLVDTLPPITSMPVPLLLTLIVFLRPRRLLLIATGSWLLVAAPVLAYLAAHPDELTSPRGLEMVIALGPVALMVLNFIPFQRGIEHWITGLQRDGARAQALAEHDALTGLYNRRAGEGFLSELLTAPDSGDVLIVFDIDRFKNVNDTHGHAVGDVVLREVSQRCAALLRKGDVFARWGGEEFLVLMRGTAEAGVMRVADALRTVISASPIAPAGTITASFGVTRFQANDTMASWLKRADEVLYEAKATGRDRVVRR